jgi:hypothetical protein
MVFSLHFAYSDLRTDDDIENQSNSRGTRDSNLFVR